MEMSDAIGVLTKTKMYSLLRGRSHKSIKEVAPLQQTRSVINEQIGTYRRQVTYEQVLSTNTVPQSLHRPSTTKGRSESPGNIQHTWVIPLSSPSNSGGDYLQFYDQRLATSVSAFFSVAGSSLPTCFCCALTIVFIFIIAACSSCWSLPLSQWLVTCTGSGRW